MPTPLLKEWSWNPELILLPLIKERVKATETKARAIEVEVASVGTQAIENYKKLVKFWDEVGEATYDAFQKGFVECKDKVIKDFPDLDLRSIIAEEPDQQKEEEELMPKWVRRPWL